MRTLQLMILAASILLAQTSPPKASKGKASPAPQSVRPASPPQPFGLKGDVLGETIDEFRARNKRLLAWGPLGAARGSFDPHFPATKQLPQCSIDQVEESEKSAGIGLSVDIASSTEEEKRAGVVKCIAALSVNDDLNFDDETTIAGVHPYQTVYYFFHDRLYMIRSVLAIANYTELRSAFVTKYGPPLVITARYQNSFGAKFTGERLSWKNSTSQIAIGQYDADGIGRGPFETQMQLSGQDIMLLKADIAVISQPESVRVKEKAYAESVKQIANMQSDAAPNNVLLVISHTALQKQCEAAGAVNRQKDM